MDNPKNKLKQTYRKIKNLEIQGATAVAKNSVIALKNYGLNIKINNLLKWKEEIKSASKYLSSARPTEPMAQNGLKFVLETIKKEKPQNVIQAKNYLKKAANDFLILIEDISLNIIALGKTEIKNNENILTHCHSYLVEQILIQAKKAGKNFKVFNTETRPLFQGHITAKKLLKAKIPVTMVTDSSAAFLISSYSGKRLTMNKIILGADAILSDGSVINKIGSFGIGSSAKEENVPLYIAAPLLKFYPKSWIKIEKRPAKEIWAKAPKKLKIINFAFDKIPASYIKGIICEIGIIKPEQAQKYAKKLYPFI